MMWSKRWLNRRACHGGHRETAVKYDTNTEWEFSKRTDLRFTKGRQRSSDLLGPRVDVDVDSQIVADMPQAVAEFGDSESGWNFNDCNHVEQR